MGSEIEGNRLFFHYGLTTAYALVMPKFQEEDIKQAQRKEHLGMKWALISGGDAAF